MSTFSTMQKLGACAFGRLSLGAVILGLGAVSGVHAQVMLTGGQFSVSPTGAATYTIPIQAPPGVGGVQPQMALGYNSQGGNGPLGVGWAIGGLSSIGLCPQTMAQDGVRGSVQVNANDRFCLDGQRLMLVEGKGSYGQAGSEYRTEVESFSRITYDGKGFRVQTKAGDELFYGGELSLSVDGVALTSQTIMLPAPVNKPYVWPLVRSKAANGNGLFYQYKQDAGDGSFRIEKVWVVPTGVSAISGSKHNSMVFSYSTGRQDSETKYFLGAPLKNAYRLASVTTSIGDKLVKRYTLSYATQSSAQDLSRLLSVQECNPNANQCLPAVTFSYSAKTLAPQTTSYALSDTGVDGKLRWWVDVDGDGKTDYCRGVGLSNSQTAGNMVCTSYAGGQAKEVVNAAVGDWGAGPDHRWWIDINGDGVLDFCRVVTGGKLRCSNFKQSENNVVVNDVSFAAGSAEKGQWWMDMDGDGLPDYCRAFTITTPAEDTVPMTKSVTLPYMSCVSFAQKDATNAVVPQVIVFAQLTSGVSLTDERRWWIDINSDGRPEYCRSIFTTSTTGGQLNCVSFAIKSGASRFNTSQATSILNLAMTDWGSDKNLRWWLDRNNDGNQHYCYGSKTTVGTATLDALKCVNPRTGEILVTPLQSSQKWGDEGKRWWMDLSGNGSTDYCYGSHIPSIRDGEQSPPVVTPGSSIFECLSSIGLKSVLRLSPSPFGLGGTENDRSWALHSVDGNPSICVIGSTDVKCTKFYAGFSNLLTEVKSGVGNSSRVMYSTLLDPGVYKTTEASAYPRLTLTMPLAVVSQWSQANGAGGFNAVKYEYKDYKAEVATGRGALGFKTMSAKELATGIETASEFEQLWPYTGLQKQSTTKLLRGSDVNGITLKSTVTNYACVTSAGVACAAVPADCNKDSAACNAISKAGVYPYAASTVERSWDLSASGTAQGVEMPMLTSSTQLDTSASPFVGNVKQVETLTQQGEQQARKVVVNEYHPSNLSGGLWRVGKLKTAVVTSTAAVASLPYSPGGNPAPAPDPKNPPSEAGDEANLLLLLVDD